MKIFIFFFFIFFFLRLPATISLVCEYLYSSTVNCFPCNYTSYSNSNSLDDCSAKNRTILNNRKILIHNFSNYSISSFFSDSFIIYSNYIDAFISESNNAIKYYESNLTFYFTEGNHLNTSKNSNIPQNYFRRCNANILMKPLYCNEFLIEGCVNQMSSPQIILKTLYLSFYVCGNFIIEDLNFFARISPFIRVIPLPKDPIRQGMFNIEAIFDDSFFKIPRLSISNVSFSNFYDIEKKFIISSLIEVSTFGGEISVENTTFANIILGFGIIHFRNIGLNSLKASFDLKSYQQKKFKLKMTNLHIYEENSYIHLTKFPVTKNAIFYFNAWLGVFETHNIILENLSGSSYNSFLFYFSDNTDEIIVSNISVINFKNISLLYTKNSSIILKDFHVSNFISNNAFIDIDILTIIKIKKMNLQNQFFISKSPFLTAIQSNLDLEEFDFININSGLFYISKCKVSVSNSNFLNIINDQYLFFFDQTLSTIKNCNFQQIISNSNIFYFYENRSEIKNSSFYELASSSLFFPSKLEYQLLDFCFFYNLSEIYNIWSYNIFFVELTINNTMFANSSIYYFLFINSKGFSLIFNNLSLISIEGKSPNIFISILAYSIVSFTNCNFEKISFYEQTTHFLEFDYSNIYFDNCYFFNVGWKNFSIDHFLSSEDNNLGYFWNNQQVIIKNSQFIMTNEVSLFSGFLFFTVGTDSVILINNVFKATNHEFEKYYQAIVISDASFVEIDHNIFSGLICSRSNSKKARKFDGPISLNGESGNSLMKNSKKLTMSNNSFYNCSCMGKGGSLFIMNYQNIFIELINFFDSKGISGGCFYIFGVQNATIANIICQNSIALTSPIEFKLTSFININYFMMINTLGNLSGAISVSRQKYLMLSHGYHTNTRSETGAGGFLIDGDVTIINFLYISKSSTNGSGGVFSFNRRSSISIHSSKFLETQSNLGGVIFVNGEISFNAENILIFSSSANTGGGLYINDAIELKIENISIVGCVTNYHGSIFISIKGEMIVRKFNNVNCFGNVAFEGSCLYWEAGVYSEFSNFILRENNNTVLFFTWPNHCLISLVNFSFYSNLITKELINTNNIQINTSFLYFYNNFFNFLENFYDIYIIRLENLQFNYSHFENFMVVQNDTNTYSNPHRFSIFELIQTNCFIKNISISITIQDNSIIFCLIFTEKQLSNITIIDSFFENTPNNYGKNKGFIIFSGFLLEIKNTKFSKMNDIPIYVDNANVILTKVIFMENLGSKDIYIKSESSSRFLFVQFTNCYFAVKVNCSVYIYGYNKVILNGNFFDNFNLQKDLNIFRIQNCALNLQEIIEININSCVFTYFSYFFGGAITIFSKNNGEYFLFLNKTIAIGNKAYLGGFMLVNGNYFLSVTQSIFLKNQAIRNTNPNGLTPYFGVGGVMIMMGNKIQILQLDDNRFLNNSAFIYSPNILTNSKIIDSHNNIFIGNSDSTDTENHITGMPQIINIISSPQTITSGIPFNLIFKICDNLNISNNILFISSVGNIKIDIFSLNSSKMVLSGLNIINNVESSKTDILNFSNIIIYSRIGAVLDLYLNLHITSLLGFSAKNYPSNLSLSFSLYLRDCQIGEIVTINQSCSKCGFGSYSLINPILNTSTYLKCKNCLTNAICPGGSLIIPNPGFWIQSNDSELTVECNHELNCINFYDDNKEILIKCKEGTKGNLCFYCENGYLLTFDKTCKQINDIDNKCLFFLLFWTLVILIFIIMSTIIAQKDSKTNSATHNSTIIIIKIFINYMQCTSLILLCNNNFLVNPINELIKDINSGSFYDSNFLSCQNLLPLFIRESVNIIVFKQIIILILPLLLWILSSLYFIMYLLCLTIKKKRNSFKKRICKELKVCLLICIFIVYPFVTKSSFNFLDCRLLSDKNDKTNLYIDPDVICWEETHLKYLILLGFPGILFWGVLFPLFIFFTGVKQIYYLKKAKEEIEKKKRFIQNNDFLGYFNTKNHYIRFIQNNVLKFFTSDYKTIYCYWDAFIFFRIFFLTFVVSLSSSIGHEITTLSLMSIIYLGLALTILLKPFKYRKCNNYEIMTLICNIYTIITSVLVNTVVKESCKIIFLSVCLLFNLIVILYCSALIMKFMYEKILLASENILNYFKYIYINSLERKRLARMIKLKKKINFSTKLN